MKKENRTGYQIIKSTEMRKVLMLLILIQLFSCNGQEKIIVQKKKHTNKLLIYQKSPHL